MLGTLGENSSLSPDEKEAVLRAAVEAAGDRVPVHLRRRRVHDRARHRPRAPARSAAGCAGLMALPCMVYEQDEREAVHHFRTLAAGTDLPIMIYNNPLAYKVDLKPEGFLGLVESAEHRGDQGIVARQPAHDRQLERARRPVPDVLRRRRPDVRERAVRCGRLGVGPGQQLPRRGRAAVRAHARGPDRGGAGDSIAGSCRSCTSMCTRSWSSTSSSPTR